jgi:hypothetical protein
MSKEKECSGRVPRERSGGESRLVLDYDIGVYCETSTVDIFLNFEQALDGSPKSFKH